ncbi:hypothetical protein PIROE2DRAFT_58866 [Piromyces sp. E2]|nr:hypothetical protein PIROE2DRAFT_58866 [Piromyces sp. E2]|eukprot:OUM67326.1 hypothetical protein PIROE2DRAFT_58866 [Piromyces sp. E2]
MTEPIEIHRIKIEIYFNDVNELKKYVEEQHINLKELMDNEYDFLIEAIKHGASLDVIKYLIEKIQYKTFNYTIKKTTMHYSRIYFPLYTALEYNNYEISDYLLENNADINFNNGSLLLDLITRGRLTLKKLKYILKNGYNNNNINSHIMKELINSNTKNLFMYIFKRFIFDNHFILLLLNLYKSKTRLSNGDINKIFNKERYKLFVIDEEMYLKVCNMPDGYSILKFLFDYDDPDELNCRIHNLNLLNTAIQNNDIDFIEKILKFSIHNYSNLAKYITSVIEKRKDKYRSEKDKEKEPNDKTIKYIMVSALETVTTITKDNVKGKYIKKKDEKQKKNKMISKSTIPLYDITYFNDIINMAIQLKNINFVKYFLENEKYQPSINLNSKSIKGEYPIFTAIQEGDLTLFKCLLEHGADYTIKDNDGNSVLIKALTTITTPYSSIFNYLLKILEGKIDMNEKDKAGNTLLFNAIGMGDNNINNVIALVKYGIHHSMDRTIKNINGDTPLTLSYKLFHKNIFEFLINYFDINEKDDQGYPPLFYTVNNKDTEFTKLLLDMGANADFVDNYGNTVLHLAINGKNEELVHILLESKKINVTETNQFGETPLMVLAKSQYSADKAKKLFEKMVMRGCDINSTDNLGNSVLFYIAQNNLNSLAKWFIEKGANIHITNKDGNTFFDYFLKSRNYYGAESICEFGCKIGRKDDITYSLLFDLISGTRHLKLLQYIYSQVKYDVEKMDSDRGQSLLQCAIQNKHDDIVAFFNTIKNIPLTEIKNGNENNNEKKKHKIDHDMDSTTKNVKRKYKRRKNN